MRAAAERLLLEVLQSSLATLQATQPLSRLELCKPLALTG